MLATKILIIASFVFIAFIILEFIYSKLVLKKDYYSLADAVTSLNLGIFSQLFTVNGALVLVVYAFVYNKFRLFDYPLHNAWYWVGALIIYDFCYYWTHRFAHEYTLFWANHVVHHSSEYYNLTTALRQPGVLGVQQLATYLPMAFIGINPEAFILLGIMDLYYQFWVHTKCVGKLGYLDKIFVTPTNHGVHHGVNQVCIDKNYGGVLIIWDRIFNTYCETDEEITFGTTKPVKSWNSLWINLEVVYAMLQDIFYTPGLLNKFKVLTSRTGVRSEAAMAKLPVPQFDIGKYSRYTVKNTMAVNAYAVFNFTIGLIGFFAYFGYFEQISHIQALLYLILFMLLAISRGFLLDQKINLIQAVMLDSIAVAAFIVTIPYFAPEFSLNILGWICVLPMLIGVIIFFKSGNNLSKNKWLLLGILFTLGGGVLLQLSSKFTSIGFGLYLVGYFCYGLQLIMLGALSNTSRFGNLAILGAFIGLILLVLYFNHANVVYITAAAILLAIVGWVAYNALRLTNGYKFSWFKLSTRYWLVAIGALLILLHDGLVFLNLTHYNSILLSGLIAVCYGVGQFMIINYATTDFQLSHASLSNASVEA